MLSDQFSPGCFQWGFVHKYMIWLLFFNVKLKEIEWRGKGKPFVGVIVKSRQVLNRQSGDCGELRHFLLVCQTHNCLRSTDTSLEEDVSYFLSFFGKPLCLTLQKCRFSGILQTDEPYKTLLRKYIANLIKKTSL